MGVTSFLKKNIEAVLIASTVGGAVLYIAVDQFIIPEARAVYSSLRTGIADMLPTVVPKTTPEVSIWLYGRCEGVPARVIRNTFADKVRNYPLNADTLVDSMGVAFRRVGENFTIHANIITYFPDVNGDNVVTPFCLKNHYFFESKRR